MKILSFIFYILAAGLLVSCSSNGEKDLFPESYRRFSQLSPEDKVELWRGSVVEISGDTLTLHGKKEAPLSFFEFNSNKNQKMTLPSGGFVKNPEKKESILVRLTRNPADQSLHIQGIGIPGKEKKKNTFRTLERKSHYRDVRKEISSAENELAAARKLYRYAKQCECNGDLPAAEKFYADALHSFRRFKQQRPAPLLNAMALQGWISVRLEQKKFKSGELLKTLDLFNSIPEYDRYAALSGLIPPDVTAFVDAEAFFEKCPAKEQKLFADLLFKRIEMRHNSLNKDRLPGRDGYRQALKWYQKAGENGDPDAQQISAEWNDPFFLLLMKMSW